MPQDARCHSPGFLLCCWLCLRHPVRRKQAGKHCQPLPQPLDGRAGRPCPAVNPPGTGLRCGVPWLPPSGLSGCAHQSQHRNCNWASHKDVSERGWYRIAAGVRADVQGPRASARPAQDCPHAQLAMQSLPRDDPSCCPRPHATFLPKAPVHPVGAQSGYASPPAVVKAATADAEGRPACAPGCTLPQSG